MAVNVMHIRRVRMCMFETIVPMPMGVRFAYRIAETWMTAALLPPAAVLS